MRKLMVIMKCTLRVVHFFLRHITGRTLAILHRVPLQYEKQRSTTHNPTGVITVAGHVIQVRNLLTVNTPLDLYPKGDRYKEIGRLIAFLAKFTRP